MARKLSFVAGLKRRAGYRLFSFLINRRIDNASILKVAYKIYVFLQRGVYINTHQNENSHFVPKLLLRKFKIGATGLLYKYEAKKAPEKVSIRKIAALPNLYTFRDKSKLPSDFIEKELYANLIERFSPPVLKRIEQHLTLTQVEEGILAAFVASQFTRTPKFRRQLSAVISYLLIKKKVDPQQFKHREFIENAFLENSYELSNKRILWFLRKFKKNLEADELMLLTTLIITEIIQKLIYDKHLTYLQLSEPEFFFISDNPVIGINFSRKTLIGPMIWEMKKEDAIIFMPISPTTAIVYADRPLSTLADKILLYKLRWFFYPLNRDRIILSDRLSPDLEKLIARL